jgi:predicted MPP superfamily phosphohydrolase
MERYRQKTIELRRKRELNPHQRQTSLAGRISGKVFSAVCALPVWGPLFSRYSEDFYVNEVTFTLPHLPGSFDDYRILFLTDLHLDIKPNALVRLKQDKLPEHDIMVLGGDFFDYSENQSLQLLKEITELTCKPTYAVLGNHDSVEIMPLLEEAGVRVLLNEHCLIERDNEHILLMGIDDVSTFNSTLQRESASIHDFHGCKILVSHSPDFLPHAAALGYDIQLSGHTHGGQFKMFNQAIFKQTKYDFAISGKWKHGELQGYTSSGFGSSRHPIRNIIPEAALVTLKRK